MDSEAKRTACREYEARLESYLEKADDGAADPEVTAHVERCPACRVALEDARLARALLREGLDPAAEPSRAFATRVLASIRAEETKRQQFWRPLEVLASRLTLVAAMVLLVLTFFSLKFAPVRHPAAGTPQVEAGEGFPALGGQASQDEVLLTLAENGNGR